MLLEPHSRSTKASRYAELVFLNTNLTRKGCTCDAAAAVRCPSWLLAAHMHPGLGSGHDGAIGRRFQPQHNRACTALRTAAAERQPPDGSFTEPEAEYYLDCLPSDYCEPNSDFHFSNCRMFSLPT